MFFQRHSDTVFTIPGFLSGAECSVLIAEAETSGFSAAAVRIVGGQQMMPAIRNNDRVTFSSADRAAQLWDRLSVFGLPEIDGLHAVALASLLRFYRYGPSQRFKMHKDGSLQEGEVESRLSFLVYLNDDFEGGATDFRTFKISPEAGLALLFVHETWHEGCVVESGIKYVFRSDVLYA